MNAAHPIPLRVLHVEHDAARALAPALASLGALPATGFVWIALARAAFARELPALQATLQRLGLTPIVDLHAADMLNEALPSAFDFTSDYELMVFRRLLSSGGLRGDDGNAAERNPVRAAREAMDGIDTRPVAFAVFDRLLVTVHPDDCLVREAFAARLLQGLGAGPGPAAAGAEADDHHAARAALRAARSLPTSPTELMLRMLNHIVDSYLELRRLLTSRLGALQQHLLDERGEFTHWQVLLDARNTLHLLQDTCEDQRAAMQEWLDAFDEMPPPEAAAALREHDLLRVRGRDVIEHIERVLSHVGRLEQSAETAVQLHFSALGHRTNDIMRTLTVLTALFLPLNLITGFFGMNFDGLPLIHSSTGVWIAITMMATIFVVFAAYFWRRRFVRLRSR